MAKEQALQFALRASKDQMLQSKLQAAQAGGADLIKIGKEFGFDFTVEEMRSVIDDQNIRESDELSDEALETVSGGLVVIAIIAILIAPLIPEIRKPGK